MEYINLDIIESICKYMSPYDLYKFCLMDTKVKNIIKNNKYYLKTKTNRLCVTCEKDFEKIIIFEIAISKNHTHCLKILFEQDKIQNYSHHDYLIYSINFITSCVNINCLNFLYDIKYFDTVNFKQFIFHILKNICDKNNHMFLNFIIYKNININIYNISLIINHLIKNVYKNDSGNGDCLNILSERYKTNNYYTFFNNIIFSMIPLSFELLLRRGLSILRLCLF
jgi:hypothetical protein